MANSPIPLSILHLTIHHRHPRTYRRRHNRRRNDPRRVHAPILTPIGNHIYRYQLQGRNIQNQKRTHLIAGNPFSLSNYTLAIIQVCRIPPLFLQLRQFLHGLHPALCQVSDTNLLIILILQKLHFKFFYPTLMFSAFLLKIDSDKQNISFILFKNRHISFTFNLIDCSFCGFIPF